MATNCTRQLLPDVNGHDLTPFIMKLLNNICDLYDEQDFIDVTFKVSNPTAMISAHRLVLSAASPYFKDLFKSDNGLTPVIELNNDIESDTFERLITFCYTGKALITIENVDAMLKAAMVLQLDDVVLTCVDYIVEHITAYSLARADCLVNDTQCVPLQKKLRTYELNNFMELSHSDEFLNFGAEKLQAIIENNNLNVSSEKDVFHAVKRWYEYDAPGRQEKLPELIGCVRLTLFDVNFLVQNVLQLPGCESLAFKAISWIGVPANRTNISLKFTAPRENAYKMSQETTFLAVKVDRINPLHVALSKKLSTLEYKGAIFQYDQIANEWQKYADVEHDTYDYGTVLMEDSIMYIGGQLGFNRTNNVKSWSLKTKSWSTLPSMNQTRSLLSAVLLNGNVYAIGGEVVVGEHTKSVEMYTPGGEWKFVSSMSTPRSSAGAVALNGKIFVMGGSNGNYALKSVERYNPSENTWTKCADMNEAVSSPGTAIKYGCIYVLGGGTENKKVERYNPQTDKWTTVCCLTIGRRDMGCVFIGDQLWAVGGFYKNNVSVYYEQFDEWVEKTPIPVHGQYFCQVVPKAFLQND